MVYPNSVDVRAVPENGELTDLFSRRRISFCGRLCQNKGVHDKAKLHGNETL